MQRNIEGMINMLTAVRDGCKITLNEQQEEVRSMVLAGLEQVKAGNT